MANYGTDKSCKVGNVGHGRARHEGKKNYGRKWKYGDINSSTRKCCEGPPCYMTFVARNGYFLICINCSTILFDFIFGQPTGNQNDFC